MTRATAMFLYLPAGWASRQLALTVFSAAKRKVNQIPRDFFESIWVHNRYGLSAFGFADAAGERAVQRIVSK